MADRNSVDGFISRRPTSRLGEHGDTIRIPEQKQQEAGPRMISGYQDIQKNDESSRLVKSNTEGLGLTRSDIDESLAQIDTDVIDEEPKRGKHVRGPRKPRSWKKIILRTFIVLVILGLAAGGYFVWHVMHAGSQVFTGDVFGLLQQKDLKADVNGRTNVLILGTSEDDGTHEGAHLTDSIMILSANQKEKNAYMISIPRDMFVDYGMACNSGYKGKVNEYFNCVNEDWTSASAETERQTKSREFFGGIVGMEIQYSAHVNYSVMRDVVGALGGVTVTIESRDPNGQMDSNFDWKCKGGKENASLATMKQNCPPSGHFIDYPNGPVTLDAEHALYLAQARGEHEPTYGFEQSNFDREKNQQKILVAIKEKALSTGTLADFAKVNNIITAIGSNLRTNFDTSEIRTLASLAKDMPSSAISSINLIDSGIMRGDGNPAAGDYNFTQLRAYIKKQISSDPVEKESAHVIVLNGSGVVGVAKTEGEKLTPLGLVVDQVANAPAGTYPASIIYNVTGTKTKTADKLAQIYGVTPVTTTPPITVAAGVDFVIIVAAPSTLQTPSATSTNP